MNFRAIQGFKTSSQRLGVFAVWAKVLLCIVSFAYGQQTIQKLPQESPASAPAQSPEQEKAGAKSGTYTFVAYNLRNYLKMWRFVDGERVMAGKPESEIRELLAVIKSTQPDILGLCEIGSLDDLHQLRKELKASGLNFPHHYLTEGSDDVRRLAILSKFRITANPKPNIQYKMKGELHLVCRGIADAYVELPSGRVRFLGIHFKSKREIEEYDQELIRNSEAYVLRRHLTRLHADKKTENDRVIVYGDFNDTTRSVAVKTVVGSSRTKAYCRPISLYDKFGLNWTYHWKYQDVYSRIDFVLANKAMMKDIIPAESYIPDVSQYPKASDHRPLVVKFK